MKIDLYKQSGEKSGTLDLPENIFNVPFNRDLVHQALVRQLANKRVALAHTKLRGDVTGGAKKPFKQKGTGNARQGSTKGPHMKGGAVIFGPRNNRNYEKDMPKKQRRKALFCALSEKVRKNQVLALEAYESTEPKTKEFAMMISKLPVDRNVLVVIAEKNAVIQKSGANMPNVKMILAGYLNIHDLQKYKNILFLKDAIGKVEEVFLNSKA